MVAGNSTWPFGINWYDLVVAAALVYGIWSGVRNGFSGEVLRVVGLVLMVVLALTLYVPTGKWLHSVSNWAIEVANLVAFVTIAVVVYVVSLLTRRLAHKRMKKMRFTAAIENVGGGAAGLLRMAVVMAWLSVVLALTRSEFWHRSVARDSQFGSFVVKQFPAVAAMVEKQFPEKMWLLNDLKRRSEPGIEEDGPAREPAK